jgi:rubrerythrin
MQGGIKAWNGITASGPPEMGMAYFSHTDKIEDLLSLAWSLEEGMRLFYESLLTGAEGNEEKKIFDWLNKSEISHQSRLSTLYDDIPGKAFESLGEYTESLLSEDGVGSVMEGGMKTGEAISWARSRPLSEILEFAIALEAQLFDLYMRLKQRVKGDKHNIFSITAEEEKKHLEKLVELFESRI